MFQSTNTIWSNVSSPKVNKYTAPTSANSPDTKFVSRTTINQSSRISSRLDHAKNDIKYIIEEISNKKNINCSVTQNVRSTNADALGVLMESNQIYSFNRNDRPQHLNLQNKKPKTTTTPMNMSHHNLRNTKFQDLSTQPNLFQKQTSLNSHPVSPQNINLEQQNIGLRMHLNEQIRQNNNLLKTIYNLQKQNQNLKQRLGEQGAIKNMDSSNMNTQTHCDSGRQKKPSIPANITATFGKKKSRDLPYQNVELVQPLKYYESQRQFFTQKPHIKQNNSKYMDIFRQLNQLKDQNQMLRQSTIQIINQQY